MRMSDEQWLKKITMSIPWGRRKRERPPSSWKKGIDLAMQERSLEDGD